MLRVGLTGGLGSGKSTIADMFAALGAHVIKADTVARDLMHPGEDVFDKIVARFGSEILSPTGEIDRPKLAQIVFAGEGSEQRLDQLNAIVHPAVIAVQMDWLTQIAESHPHAVAIVESALIFESAYADSKRSFHRILLVVAPDEVKVARFVSRTLAGRTVSPQEQAALEADARQRLSHQIPDAKKAPRCDYILDNSGSLENLQQQVRRIFVELCELAREH